MVILVRLDNGTRHAFAHLLLLGSELFGMSHLEGRIASMEHWEGTGLNAIYPYVHRVRAGIGRFLSTCFSFSFLFRASEFGLSRELGHAFASTASYIFIKADEA